MQKYKTVLKIGSWTDGLLLLESPNDSVSTVIKSIVKDCEQKKHGYIMVELSEPYQKRTLKENAKWWAMCTEYANYCGMTRDEVALGVKWRAVDEGLWSLERVLFSKDKWQPKSTTKATVGEMATLIEVLYRIASEDGYIFEE